MSGPRFFVAPEAVQGDEVVLDKADSKHLLQVLRARPGDRFYAICEGVALAAELLPGGGEARGRIVGRERVETEPPLAITLYQGLAKGEKMEWVIQKGTELGASRFVPVACARSVVKLEPGKAADKIERWQRIAKEAAEQSRRGRVPEVAAPLTWKAAVAEAAGADLVLVPWESQGGPGQLRALLTAPRETPLRSVAVFIGPEGGLTEAEVAAARAAGAHPVGLGPRILRTETAGLAVLSALLFACGDW
jgi:16S rRNA (uracil1498-N3)-methyltransferase